MSAVRPRKKKAANLPSEISPDDLARHTEEHVALASELVELARELCEATSELNRLVQLVYTSLPTRN